MHYENKVIVEVGEEPHCIVNHPGFYLNLSLTLLVSKINYKLSPNNYTVTSGSWGNLLHSCGLSLGFCIWNSVVLLSLFDYHEKL